MHVITCPVSPQLRRSWRYLQKAQASAVQAAGEGAENNHSQWTTALFPPFPDQWVPRGRFKLLTAEMFDPPRKHRLRL